MSETAALVPVIWLLGKTAAGKTSLVADLTGQGYDEVGNGFKPMTRETRAYAFPPDAPLVEFLDTRGLGDAADHDPAPALALAEARAQVLMVVARAEDLALDEILGVVRALRRAHPDWPLVVVQTCLHHLYPPGRGHDLPYPFTGTATDDTLARLPLGLRQALCAQRALFAGLPGGKAPVFVPVDVTRPEDGVVPANYGMDRLLEELEALLPDVITRLRALSGRDDEAQVRTAVVLPWALAAAAANAVPAPVLGGLGSASVQALMVRAVARRCGLGIDRALWGEFLSTLGAGFLLGFGGGWIAQQGLKLGLGWGTALSAAWTFAVTWGIGEAALYYFRERKAGRTPERAALRARYEAAFREARAAYRQTRSLTPPRLPAPEPSGDPKHDPGTR
ncbi:GTPase [Pararhodospirillum oryzae]|uniref:Kinase n=1 Tax=Pararhodospirillum oryzae TaxID=478448 RepID=A0A512H834_9PROT|nr:GTPase domain-containing protein [Pararhodospirillum oryzae]GEO81601.1 kinase [Pararhodospirillum oryzae]